MNLMSMMKAMVISLMDTEEGILEWIFERIGSIYTMLQFEEIKSLFD